MRAGPWNGLEIRRGAPKCTRAGRRKMARLILSVDGVVIKEYTLAKERTTIGRKAHNDVQIEDTFLSGEHAVIVQIGNDCILEDMDSTNGTVVNGKPIKRHLLKSNEVIEFGDYKINFVDETDYTGENFLFSRMVRTKTVKPINEQ
jgi:pSer/pThr/pTyr-binding forkhead associated (FHA) protein